MQCTSAAYLIIIILLLIIACYCAKSMFVSTLSVGMIACAIYLFLKKRPETWIGSSESCSESSSENKLIKITRAISLNFDDVKRLTEEFRTTFTNDPEMSDKDRRFYSFINNRTYIAKKDDKGVGIITIHTNSAGGGNILLVMVDSKHRGQGIGTELIKYAINSISALLPGPFTVKAPKTCEKIFKKLGFKEVDKQHEKSGELPKELPNEWINMKYYA